MCPAADRRASIPDMCAAQRSQWLRVASSVSIGLPGREYPQHQENIGARIEIGFKGEQDAPIPDASTPFLLTPSQPHYISMTGVRQPIDRSANSLSPLMVKTP